MGQRKCGTRDSRRENKRIARLLELGGVVECAHNRVGGLYFDQLKWSGHDIRISDLDCLADL